MLKVKKKYFQRRMRWPTKVKKIYDPIIEQGMAAALIK